MDEREGQAEPVLETVPTGPPVVSLRQAREAVGFYLAEPRALPRPGRLDRLLWGLAVPFRATRLIWRDRALLRSALLPTTLTLLGAAIFAGLASWHAGDDALPGRGPGGLQTFLVTFVGLASMPPTLLQRQWTAVANQARRALGLTPGEEPFPGEWYVAMLWREGVKAIRQGLVVSIGLLPVIIFIELFPFGDSAATVVGVAWTFYWVVVDAFELPIEVVPGPRHATPAPWYARGLGWLGRKSRLLRFLGWAGRMVEKLTRPWGEEVHFTERHPWEVAGYAAGVGLVLAIPLVGLFFRSVAITAATDLIGRLGEPAGAAPDHGVPGPSPL